MPYPVEARNAGVARGTKANSDSLAVDPPDAKASASPSSVAKHPINRAMTADHAYEAASGTSPAGRDHAAAPASRAYTATIGSRAIAENADAGVGSGIRITGLGRVTPNHTGLVAFTRRHLPPCVPSVMRCDRCQSEATVHEVTVKNGVRVERHLCESCAGDVGLGTASGPMSEAVEMLKLVLDPQRKPEPAVSVPPACPTCGLTFEEFKQHERLGCPSCYEALAPRLMPIIERAHEGAGQHVGKAPRRGCDHAETGPAGALAALVLERAHRAEALRKLLDEAVRTEQYERAAKVRDEIRKLTAGDPAGDSPRDADQDPDEPLSPPAPSRGPHGGRS